VGKGTDAASTFFLPLLALDIGTRHIGVAVCDRLGISAHGIVCLQRKDSGWPQRVLKLIAEYGCRGIIIGLPKNMDGSEGSQAADCRDAAGKLAALSRLPICFQDERLSTWSAKQRLREQGLSAKKAAARVDQTAAAIILEDFLAAHPGAADA